jgi:hypothetical protein
MAERTLPKALSGAEITEAVIAKLRASMRNDCRLQPHMAYGSFSVKVRVDLKFQDPNGHGDTQTAHEAVVEEGELEPDAFPLTVEFEDEPKPPNQVRMETGLGIPTLVTSPGGKVEEKKVTYRDPEFAAKPKGKPGPKGKGRG